jgi:hypothetical protein
LGRAGRFIWDAHTRCGLSADRRFLGLAAYNSNSREAAGLAGVLRAVQHQTFGGGLLAIAAVGLLAFGFFEMVEAAARRTQAAKGKRAAAS